MTKCHVCGLDMVNDKCPGEKEYSSNNPNHFFLWDEDGVRYWTTSPFLRNIFNPKKEKFFVPVSRPGECKALANREALESGLKQEKVRYENGYVWEYTWVLIKGKKWKKGRWVKDVDKAKVSFDIIKKMHPELFRG